MSYADAYFARQQDPATSYWLARAMVDLARRDPLDAFADVEALYHLAKMRMDEALATAPKPEPTEPETFLFTPRTPEHTRIYMSLDAADHSKIGRGGPWSATVTDRSTGKVYDVAGAECSAGPHCFCDAVILREVPTHFVEIPIEGQSPVKLRLFQRIPEGK
jgi:hypothetical protein